MIHEKRSSKLQDCLIIQSICLVAKTTNRHNGLMITMINAIPEILEKLLALAVCKCHTKSIGVLNIAQATGLEHKQPHKTYVRTIRACQRKGALKQSTGYRRGFYFFLLFVCLFFVFVCGSVHLWWFRFVSQKIAQEVNNCAILMMQMLMFGT